MRAGVAALLAACLAGHSTAFVVSSRTAVRRAGLTVMQQQAGASVDSQVGNSYHTHAAD